ncbi:MAG: hypothetical protein ACI4RS_06350 [Monoglobaceae bacterium]
MRNPFAGEINITNIERFSLEKIERWWFEKGYVNQSKGKSIEREVNN